MPLLCVHSDFTCTCMISFPLLLLFGKKLPTSLSKVVDLFHWSLVLTEALIYGTFWGDMGFELKSVDLADGAKVSQPLPLPLD